ncbi:polycomb group RING finger protein 1-like isoform X2 [Biomphalaria glabrata]|uniref:Polycomb group RING finger protein 1-like isoform X2 n=2 Tax=Biomphalaria TaxID=6525 RepID=A0A2C9JDU8_BIOGL|nr:polycomb group RING finger protein 1-like isoform X2 [Biomphalaria glabrata]KAI8768232.1 polycomb group RING finger protein 1-like isoform X2 [Biomphalaria glabrata]KAI8777385.1 polycomb group RING finger protein 1 isoform X2 [Biomphalaria glabrata]KAK0055275.1 polycomb group RING finger protein 1-like isoform X2 [Biomphalaria pfeifferi]
MDEVIKMNIQDINPHVVCSLCNGYFIDATTITECLHTFCKSCIVKYLMNCKHCPQCQLKVHETHPLFLLRPDRTLQDIVYKLIPNLFENEELRREEFNKSRGMAVDKKPGNKTEEPVIPKLSSIINNHDGHLYKNDEQICLCLERYRSQGISHCGKILPLRSLDRKFLRCSIRVLVSHLKAMLYKKLAIPSDVQVEVICDREVLADEVSMKQIFLMNWFGKETPMVLYYRFRETSELGNT